MNKKIFIQLVADYGVGDPAFAEVTQKLVGIDTRLDVSVSAVAVPKYSTIATGMWIYQLATVNHFPGLIIYSNTAPRIKHTKDEEQTYKGMYGHPVYARLKNEIPVIAVHVGYTFSFIKSEIADLRLVRVKNKGSQFRSRDFYPEGAIAVAKGDRKALGASIPFDSIPEPPADKIGFIDGFGNMKTTLRVSQFPHKPGQKISIQVNGIRRVGIVGGETYHVEDGELSLAPGSTGGKDKFIEIWVKGGNAWETFGKPRVEEKFQVERV